MKMVGLADCNSFFASCEKVFRPDLYGKPVVVLSNNDGCIVALSKEAKQLGFSRGSPYFEVRERLAATGTAVFSSNYTLYQDMSDRVMDLLNTFTGDIEKYSIDECFFHPPELKENEYDFLAAKLAKNLKKGTGIPVSIGIARTKTLAKIANHIAKKQNLSYVLKKEDEESVLMETPLEDVWGLGWRSVKKLNRLGVYTAFDFSKMDDALILKILTSVGYRTALELRGISAIGRESREHTSFSSSISFAEPETSFEQICKAVACHCATVCEKLRTAGCIAGAVEVMLVEGKLQHMKVYFGSGKLPYRTAYMSQICSIAEKTAEALFIRGKRYKSVRVCVSDLISEKNVQKSLFGDTGKQDMFVEKIGGNRNIVCASTVFTKKQDLAKRAFLSPLYTTRWDSLPIAGRSDRLIIQVRK